MPFEVRIFGVVECFRDAERASTAAPQAHEATALIEARSNMGGSSSVYFGVGFEIALVNVVARKSPSGTA